MTYRELHKMLVKDGWEIARVQGSHYIYKHHRKTATLTVPRHGGDLKIGLVNALLKQAELK